VQNAPDALQRTIMERQTRRQEERDRRGDGRDGNARGDRRDDSRSGPDERPQLDRREVIDREDGRTIIRDGDNRVIIRENDRIIIQNDDSDRLSRDARDVRVDRNRSGNTVTVVERANGSRVTTVTDPYGNIVSRTRTNPDGREIVIIEEYRGQDRRGRRGSGIGPLIDLPPLVLDIPRNRYIVEADEAEAPLIEETLIAPPVERVERAYSLGEIRRNYRVLEKVRSIDLNTITFEFGAWEISEDEVDRLDSIGKAIEDIVKRNPDEVFLIEGHTDAVGSNEDNLALSDRRAESVAIVLTEHFDIPAENLVTQGYGEEQLKVETDREERENRRVTLRRITPLLSSQQAR
jgi:outer membrane protein OmpA-like peptidoglycan-associated protein